MEAQRASALLKCLRQYIQYVSNLLRAIYALVVTTGFFCQPDALFPAVGDGAWLSKARNKSCGPLRATGAFPITQRPIVVENFSAAELVNPLHR